MTVVPVGNIVNIPNILLQNSLSIVCFIVSVDDKGTMTTSKQILRVEARLKPADYVYTETEIYTWDQFAAKQDEKLSKALAAEKAEVERIVSNLRDTKLDKPSAPPTGAGKILKVLSVNEDGTFTCEWADAPSSGDYFEIKIDWDAMTCNHSASEIRQAFNDGKPFVGDCIYDYTNLTDEANNVATIVQWDAASGNKVWKYIIHEDKTVEEYEHSFRLLENDPVRITVSSSDTISRKNTAAKLTELINRNGNMVPIIYLIKDNFIYYLIYFEETSDTAEGFFRFACITSTSVKIAEITGTNTAVTFTEKFFS